MPGNRLATPSRRYLSMVPKSCNGKPSRDHWFPMKVSGAWWGRAGGEKQGLKQAGGPVTRCPIGLPAEAPTAPGALGERP